jgi:hypothetical protein
MNSHDAALAAAGLIGSAVAVIHGVVTQRLMIAPFERLALADGRIAAPIRRLVPCLLHFSTFNWFLGGLVLIVAAVSFGPDARLVTAMLVGSSYLFGSLGNFWGNRGRHPGWALYAVAVALIVYGVAPRGD